MIDTYTVPSEYILGQIPEEQLDLSDLPEFPVVSQPELLGFIVEFRKEGNYGFIMTNGQGIDKNGKTTLLRSYFFHITDWFGDKNVVVGDVVKFALAPKTDKKQRAELVCPLDISQESYNIGKKYTGPYSSVNGTIRNQKICFDFPKAIQDLFLSTDEGKEILRRNLDPDVKSDEEKSASALDSHPANDKQGRHLFSDLISKLGIGNLKKNSDK